MINLNDLRAFEKVATHGSFTLAARALGTPKSSVSRSVERLEVDLAVRLIQRTTRRVVLTPAGEALRDRCGGPLSELRDALEHAGSLADGPGGTLRISAGIGFGINVLGEELPLFLARHPKVRVSLDLTSKLGNPIDSEIDVAIRLGPLPDSTAVSISLGSMSRYLCAAPVYLKRRSAPRAIAELPDHDTVEMPRGDGRPPRWTFTKDGKTESVELRPRVTVNEALTICGLVRNGAGLGIVSGYICGPEFERNGLVHVLPDWIAPPVEVSLVLSSNRQLNPAVRAFASHMKAAARPGTNWLRHPRPSHPKKRSPT